jgi:hypothetical protein
MLRRIKKIGLTVGALAALALGGSAISTAATTQPSAPAPVVQADPPGGANDTTTPDAPGSSVPEPSGSAEAPSSESSSSESAPSDGPGGYADEAPGGPGASADTQQQGEF